MCNRLYTIVRLRKEHTYILFYTYILSFFLICWMPHCCTVFVCLPRILNFEKRSSAMPGAISQTSGLFGKVFCRPMRALPSRPMRGQYSAPAEYGSPTLLVELGPVNVSGIYVFHMPNVVDWRSIHHHYTGLGKAHMSCETVHDF